MPLSPELLSPMDERTMQRIWQDAGRSTSGGSGGAPPRGASGIGSGGAERRGLGRGAGKGGSPGLGPVQGGDSPNFGPVAGGGGLGGAAWRSSSSSQRGIDPWSKDKRERSPLVGPSGNSSLTSSLEGGFNLDLPAHADSGRWSRGLKVRLARVRVGGGVLPLSSKFLRVGTSEILLSRKVSCQSFSLLLPSCLPLRMHSSFVTILA